MNIEQKKERILSLNPFSKILGSIKDIKPIYHELATTGNVFLITSEKGKSYKISFYDDVDKARVVESHVLKCRRLLPKYHGREGNLLLFDWIKGEVLTEILDLDTCHKLGVIYGEIHKLNDLKKGKTSSSKLKKYYQRLCDTNYFGQKTLDKVKDEFDRIQSILSRHIILEMNDANPANFIMKETGEILIVDEEALNHNIQGRGLIGLVKRFGKEQKKAFWKGYKEKHPHDYFTRDYETALTHMGAVLSVQHRLHKYGPEHHKTKEAIKEFLKYFG